MAIWNGRKPLARPNEYIFQGAEFEPTDSERRAFGDMIIDDEPILAYGRPEGLAEAFPEESQEETPSEEIEETQPRRPSSRKRPRS